MRLIHAKRNKRNVPSLTFIMAKSKYRSHPLNNLMNGIPPSECSCCLSDWHHAGQAALLTVKLLLKWILFVLLRNVLHP